MPCANDVHIESWPYSHFSSFFHMFPYFSQWFQGVFLLTFHLGVASPKFGPDPRHQPWAEIASRLERTPPRSARQWHAQRAGIPAKWFAKHHLVDVGGDIPLKNMNLSVGMIISNIWKNKIHVPKHQSATHVGVESWNIARSLVDPRLGQLLSKVHLLSPMNRWCWSWRRYCPQGASLRFAEICLHRKKHP